MELSEVIVGTRLNEIQKRSDDVRLVFEDTRNKRIYVLSFEGWLFETSSPTLNRRVKNIQVNETLGFRATTQLRHLNKNPQKYRQLFIQMEGSNDSNKLELLGALKNYKVSPRRIPAISNRTATKTSIKKTAKKSK